MKTRILTSFLTCLSTSLYAQWTWTGGGTDQSMFNSFNWSPVGAPSANADIVFNGNAGFSPFVDAGTFPINSVTFDVMAGAFTFGGPGSLAVDAGIANNSAQAQTFDLQVLANLSQTFNAVGDELIFNGGVQIPLDQTLTISGGFATTIETLAGTGTLTKSGSGNLILDGSGAGIGADLVLNVGSTFLGNTAAHTFAATSTVEVNNTAKLFIQENTDFHGALTLQSEASLGISAGKGLTMKSGSTIMAAGPVRLSSGNSNIDAVFRLEAGATGAFSNGLHIEATSGSLFGRSGVTVTGAGTVLNVSGTSDWASNGVALVSITDNATATFEALNIDTGTGFLNQSFADVFVQSGADVTSGSITFSVGSVFSNFGVWGNGSTWTQTGASTLSIRAAGLAVVSGGVFTTGTGQTTIGTNGSVYANGGTFEANGDVVITSGGELVGNASGFTLAPGKSLTVQAGGVASFSGDYAISNRTYSVTGGTALLENNDANFIVTNDGILNLAFNGDVEAFGGVNVGINGTGTLNAGGSFTSVTAAGASTWGSGSGGLAVVGFNSLAVGSFAHLTIGSDGGNGTATVASSADVVSTGLQIATSTLPGTVGTLTLTGAGTTWTVTNATGPVSIGATQTSQGILNVQSGALFTAGSGGISVENTGQIFITGGTLTSAGPVSLDGQNARLEVNSSGTLSLAPGQRVSTSGGADAVFSTLTMNGWDGVIEGVGSTWTGTSGIGAIIGGTAPSILTIKTGGLFTTAGTFTVANTGTVNIQGGTLTLNGTANNQGSVNLLAGTLNLDSGNFRVEAGGFLGENVTLGVGQRLNVLNATVISAGQTLALDGGYLSTNNLINIDGRFDFRRGTLELSAVTGLDIGSGPLGNRVTLGVGSTLVGPSGSTIAVGATLRLEGGEFSSSALTNYGTLDHQDGVLTLSNSLANAASGRIFLSGSASPAGAINNAGRITLQDGLGYLGGAGTLTNTGVVTGDGTIARPGTNSVSGQIRAEAGKTLLVTGTFAPNAGTLSLEGGTLEFTSAITNATGGFISGRGSLRTGGLTNSGVMAFSGGNADVHGDVTNAAGGRIVTSSAGAVTTFFDDVVHNGLEIFTGAGANTVFFGLQSGAGPFTGTGAVYYVGDLRPGNSPAAVSYEGDLIFGSGTDLMLELGGRSAGLSYDTLDIGGTFFADGTLDVVLYDGFTPEIGDWFDLFDAGAVAGSFDAVNLPTLADGLGWDVSGLQSRGELAVVPEPGISALLLAGIGLLGLARRRNSVR